MEKRLSLKADERKSVIILNGSKKCGEDTIEVQFIITRWQKTVFF